MTPPPSPDPARQTDRRRRLAMSAVVAGGVVIGIGQTVVFAVLPPIARRIGLHDLQVLTVFMISAVFWVTMGPIWGRRSDHYGRRPFILSGLFAFALSMALFATTIRIGMAGALGGLALYGLLLLTRSIYGVFGSAMPPAAQAYIADRTPPARRTGALAAFSAAFGFGAMVGPVFAAATGAFGAIAPLYAVSALALIATAMLFFLVQENTPPRERARRPRLAFRDPRIRVILGFGFVTAIAIAIPTQFTTFYVIDRLGADEAEAVQLGGVALSTAAGASLFAQVAIVQRFSPAPFLLLRLGPVIVAAGHIVIAMAGTIGPLAFGMLLSGLGAGLIAPGIAGAASLAVSPEEQGSVAGLANASVSASFIAAPLFGYAIYALSPQALFTATALIAALAAAFASARADWRGPRLTTGDGA